MATGMKQLIRIFAICAAIVALLCGCRSASLFDLPAGTFMEMNDSINRVDGFPGTPVILRVFNNEIELGRAGDMGRFPIKHLTGDFYQFQDPQPPIDYQDSAQVTYIPQAVSSDSISVKLTFNSDIDIEYTQLCLFVYPFDKSFDAEIEEFYLLSHLTTVYDGSFRYVSFEGFDFRIPAEAEMMFLRVCSVEQAIFYQIPFGVEQPGYRLGCYEIKRGYDMEIHIPAFNLKNIYHAPVNGKIFQYRDGKIYWDGWIFEPSFRI